MCWRRASSSASFCSKAGSNGPAPAGRHLLLVRSSSSSSSSSVLVTSPARCQRPAGRQAGGPEQLMGGDGVAVSRDGFRVRREKRAATWFWRGQRPGRLPTVPEHDHDPRATPTCSRCHVLRWVVQWQRQVRPSGDESVGWLGPVVHGP